MTFTLDTRSDSKHARIRGIAPEMVVALVIARDVFYERHEALSVSCGTDGTHHANSPHYTGHAVDIRPPHDDAKRAPILADLRAALGPDFQVIDEQSHLHIQYRPADPLNVEGAAVKG